MRDCEKTGLCYKLSISLNRAAIEQLCSYIPYFESATKESVCKWDGGEKLGENHYTMPYPVYAQTLDKFIQDVYSSNLMCHNYFEIMEEAGLDTSNEEKIIGAIDSAELDLARAILTGYVRQERFCDGLWASAVEDKVFWKLLKRMQQIATSG